MVGADRTYCGACSLLFSPEQGQSAASIEGTDAVLEQGPQQSLQVPLSGIEYLRAQVSHVLCVAQVSDGEVDNKRHQERNCSCS